MSWWMLVLLVFLGGVMIGCLGVLITLWWYFSDVMK